MNFKKEIVTPNRLAKKGGRWAEQAGKTRRERKHNRVSLKA